MAADRHPLAQFAIDYLKRSGARIAHGAVEPILDDLEIVVDVAADEIKSRIARAKAKRPPRKTAP